MKNLVVFLGMPGSGKDTQVKKVLLRRPKTFVIKAGDLVREVSKTDPELKKDLNRGNLVNNERVNNLIYTQLKKIAENSWLISNGFPRVISQAKWLEDVLKDLNIKLAKVIYLRISDEEALRRLLKRGRSDDTEPVIKRRLQVFHTATDPVIDLYRSQGILAEVNGEQTIEAVAKDTKTILGW